MFNFCCHIIQVPSSFTHILWVKVATIFPTSHCKYHFRYCWQVSMLLTIDHLWHIISHVLFTWDVPMQLFLYCNRFPFCMITDKVALLHKCWFGLGSVVYYWYIVWTQTLVPPSSKADIEFSYCINPLLHSKLRTNEWCLHWRVFLQIPFDEGSIHTNQESAPRSPGQLVPSWSPSTNKHRLIFFPLVWVIQWNVFLITLLKIDVIHIRIYWSMRKARHVLLPKQCHYMHCSLQMSHYG